MKKIAFFVSGDGVFLDYVLENRHVLGETRVEAIFFDKDSKSYRTLSERPEVLAILLDYGRGRDVADQRIAEILDPLGIDACFVTYDRIIGPSVLARFPHRFFNLHLSLLPLYPMLNAADRSTGGSELFFGASFHEVTSEVDRGRLLGQLILAKDPSRSILENRLELLEKARHFYLDMIYKVLFESRRGEAGELVFDRAAYGSLPFNPALSVPRSE